MDAPPTFSTTLESPRLQLRAYRLEDGAALARLIGANRERLRRNFPPLAQGLHSEPEAEAFIAEAAAQWQARKIYHYGIWTQGAPALIGQLKIKNLVWDVPSAELSYFIDAGALRRGYASEAVLTVLREAFERLKFQRLFARIIASNAESLELSRKLGMSHEGLHRLEFRCGFGELHDVHYFSITGADYPALAQRAAPAR